MKIMKLYLLFALMGITCAQGPLNTYDRIRSTLLGGSELVMTIDTAQCQSQNLEADYVINMPLRHWRIVGSSTSAEEIHSDDVYFDTQDPSTITYIMRTLNIYPDDTVRATLTVTGSNVTHSTMTCSLGNGAVAHQLIPGNDLVELDTYNELKTELLLGDHVEAVGFLSQCQNGESLGMDLFILGYQIQRFQIIGDGTPGQYIVIDDVAVVSADGSDFFVGTDLLVIFPNNTANVVLAALDQNLVPVNTYELVCNLGTDLKFDVHNRDNEDTYIIYQEVKDATLLGHDMELVTFLSFCDVLEGEDFERQGLIISARFEDFQLFNAGELWGPLEHIAFNSWGISVTGAIFDDEAKVYEDGTLTIKYSVTGGDAGMSTGLLSCPLGSATVFHAVRRNRAPVIDYQEIVDESLNQGRIFEIKIDFSLCSTTKTIEPNTTLGAIAWQSYVLPDSFYYADLTVMNIEDSGSLAWDAAGVAVLPDNTVQVLANLYDIMTGSSLVGGNQVANCTIGESVIFYRYP